MPKYEPPYTADEMLAHGYPTAVVERLKRDPAHRWRMLTGLELIHRDKTRSELNRIWKNWQLMTEEQKARSDAECERLFGVDNETLFNFLIPQYKTEVPGINNVKMPEKRQK